MIHPNLMSEFYLDQVKKCVTFIFAKEKDKVVIPLGTGFFVGIQLQPDLHAVYFVTAKHVLQSDKAHAKVLLRMNTNEGNLEYIEIDSSRHTILTHPITSNEQWTECYAVRLHCE